MVIRTCGLLTAADEAALGLGVSQAGHLVCSALFCTIHVGQSQLPAVFLKRDARLFSPVARGSFVSGAV